MTRLADYGTEGLIGVLTPQANTTVEPEFWILLPQGWSMLNARLTSSCDTIETRLLDYTTKFESSVEQFANAPIKAVAIACTGASYLIGREEETRITDAMQVKLGVPVLTAAQAAKQSLQELGAKRIALLTPYPDTLNELSTTYWESQGFEVITKAGPSPERDAFHPIYAMTGNSVYDAYRRLSETGIDVVLMLGTGMATLSPILKGKTEGLSPAVSCNLALIWATVKHASPSHLALRNLQSWIDDPHWVKRLKVMFA